MSIDINALAVQSIDDVKASAEELARLKGWTLKSATGFIRLLPLLIKRAEGLGSIHKLTGAEKQAYVVAVFFKLVKLPWWLPQSIAKPFLEAGIDAVVEALKSKF